MMCLSRKVHRPSLSSLPAELRNQIYTYILADATTEPTTYSLHHHPHYTSLNPAHHISRPYLGLTQANRLLRAEFTPLYTPHKPHINFADAAAYLDAFPLHNKKQSKRVADIFRTLTKPVRSNDTSIIEILPLLQEYANLPFILTYPSGIPTSHGRAKLIDLTIWLAGGSMFYAPNLVAHDAFASVGISRKDVKNRMAPVLNLTLRDEPSSLGKYRVLNDLVTGVKNFEGLRMEGRGGGVRFAWTPRERYVRIEEV